MRKRKLTIVCAVVLVVLLGAFLLLHGRKPYKNLDAAQIASAEVLVLPPNETVEIENIPELVSYLKEIVIYNRDNSYTEYAGRAVIFTLRMTDGTETEIMEYNPFVVIDGVGYRTKYEPCEALSSYVNRLLDTQ